MREIKFRGKRVDNGEWVYGFVYRHDPPLKCLSSEETELPHFAILSTGFADWNMQRPIEQHSVHGNTVGQYTGLKDKNGKEIYEGDLIAHNKNVYVICWRDNMGMCLIDIRKFDGGRSLIFNKDNWRDWLWIYGVRKYIQIIGNVHDNPELIGS